MIRIPETELGVLYSRSGGPGGQNVNRRETRVQISFDVVHSPSLSDTQKQMILSHASVRHLLTGDGVILIAVDTHRKQRDNFESGVERLHHLLARALAPKKKRIPTKASRGAKERRLAAKKKRSQTKVGRRIKDHE